MFVQADNAVDHLPGVRDELAVRGLTSARQDEPYATPRIARGTRVVVVTSTAPRCALALRQAARAGARTALLLDGVTDWRNTLLNPRQTESYLRPAGVDLVLCSGLSDARVLRGLGNRAAATGLPRIDAAFGAPPASRDRRAEPVLVATANTPAFSDAERARLLAALSELRDEAGYAGVPLAWRLTGGLDAELGVASDDRPLREVLAEARATICTPSTLVVESMRAGMPTALLHAEGTPLWHAAAWVWQPSEGASVADPTRVAGPPAGLMRWVDSAQRLLRQLSMPTREQLDRQRECLMWLDASSGGARSAELVAEALAELARLAPPRAAPPEPSAAASGPVASISSAEGVMFEAVAERQRALDNAVATTGRPVRTIVVAWDGDGERRARRALPDATICRLDPHEPWDINTGRLIDAIGGATGEPAAALVHAADTPRLIAQRLPTGAPVVAVAHLGDGAFGGWQSAWAWSAALAVDAGDAPAAQRHAGERGVWVLPADRAEAPAVIAEVLNAASTASTARPALQPFTPALERLPARTPRRDGRRRVVSLVSFEETPLGGVTTFSLRLADAFAANPSLGYDAHTLFVAWDASSASRAHAMLGERASLCVLDRSRPMHEILDHLRRAVELCEPDLVLPNYTDANAMVAAQLRHTGVRCVGIGHTDDDAYRELLLQSEWDGAVAVSESVRSWLEPLAGDRPCETIVYGVPIADRPRTPASAGPLEIVYLGRVVQPQKRVMDLVPVMRELDERGAEARLHIVGDGPAMGPLRRAFARAGLSGVRVEFHGERDAAWVARFLPTADVSLLVSEAEGTSISMLEAMGAGVVPAVTAVASGVSEWVEPRGSGVVAPIGDAEAMADELAWLAADRGRLAALGAEAHRRVASSQSVGAMAQRYAAFFDRVMATPMRRAPDTAGVTPIEPLRWASCEPGDPEAELRWTVERLREAGFARIATEPGEAGDAIVQDARRAAVVEPRGGAPIVRIGQRACRDELIPLVERLAAEGFRRIAIYGLGRHTQWRAGVFGRDDLPVVGIIDDAPPPSGEAFGLPVVTLDAAADRLRPDAVLLSSDAWEDALHERTMPLEAAGVRVQRIYGERLQAAAV